VKRTRRTRQASQIKQAKAILFLIDSNVFFVDLLLVSDADMKASLNNKHREKFLYLFCIIIF